MILELDATEQRLTKWLAQKRIEYNRANGITRPFGIIRNLTPEAHEIESLGAELAFARLFNVYPDLSFDQPGRYFDVRRAGLTIDVKETAHDGGHLAVTVTTKLEHGVTFIPDRYALMVGTFPRYAYRGEFDGPTLLIPARISHRWKEPAWIAAQHELTLEQP